MDCIALNRPWRFRQDPDNTGLQEGWHQAGFDFARGSVEMAVPSCWEETFEDYEGVGWYATTVHIGADKAGEACRLIFAAANYRTTVWVNGREAGTNEGGYTPFEFRIDDYLQYDADNTIVARVVSPIVTRDLRIDGLGPNDMPHWRGGLTAGIWQPVSLQFNKSAWIADAFYQPDLASGAFLAEFTIECTVTAQADVVICLTGAHGQAVGAASVATKLLRGTNRLAQSLIVKEPVPWDCGNPHLYTATATLLINGQPVARSVERIGLREFTYMDGRFFLNGKRIYLRGGFWEGVYALHQSYPADREVVRREIALAKAAGLNLLRPWRRPVPPIILEEADAAGLLVIASPAVECMSCWPTVTPEMPQRIEHEIRELILRDRNHACIIWWEMFNEVTRPEVAALIAPMSRMARELDPTRLVLDESGGWADGAHFYLPRSERIESLSEVHSYVRAPVSDAHWERYQQLGTTDMEEGNARIGKGSSIFMSEFGYGGWPELGENCRRFRESGNPLLPAYRHHRKLLRDLTAAMQACGLDEIYPDADALCRDSQGVQARGNRRMLEALLANPHVSGYCLHAFTDGDWILGAGIIDHWQRPKAVYHAIARTNTVPQLLCFPHRRNLRKGESIECDIVLRGENAPLPDRIELVGESGRQESSPLKWSAGNNFRRIQITVPEYLLATGRNSLEVRATGELGKARYSAVVELFVVPERPASLAGPLVVYDPAAEITPWLNERGYDFVLLEDWVPATGPTTFLFVPDDVAGEAHLRQAASALQQVADGHGAAVFLQPPATREAQGMLREYGADSTTALADNRLFQSGVFPFKLTCRPSFALWEAALHVAKAHPVFDGLPQDCLMDEPYHEVAPVESFYQLDAEEAPAQTLTWFRPEVIATKAKTRTYLGGEDLWHGTDLAVVRHGAGRIILSTLILRRKVAHDPVAGLILGNILNHAATLIKEPS